MRGRQRKSVERFADAPLDGALLEVEDVHTVFETDRGLVRAVDGVTFSLERGKTLGVVGESGCGKSVLSRSIMGLLANNGTRTGRIMFEGRDLAHASTDELRSYWGAQMAMVFQDPMTSLNPVIRIGKQITESLRHHMDVSKEFADESALALLQSVGIPEAKRRMREYPHQLSGGMRQRVMIAIALACGPKLLFADEPTTALDVTVQAQILDLLQAQQRERYMGMVLVTHDLGVVAGRTDDIAVMYAGRFVETAPTRTLFARRSPPVHRGAAEIDPEDRATEPHPARRDQRTPARPREPAAGLQVRAAVPVRADALPHRGTGARRRRHPRPRVSLLLSRSAPRRGATHSPRNLAAGQTAAGTFVQGEAGAVVTSGVT